MASTSSMSYPHQSKKMGNLAQDCFTEGMVDHEMHLKMSKKIAQLTKVIYALNTKNDEHEQVVKMINLQHDKEKNQLLLETKAKLEALNGKLSVEADLRKKIEALESNIEEHEKQKKKLLYDFDEFKGECANHEDMLRIEHQQKMTLLSKELQKCQKDFTEKMTTFEGLLQAFEQEKTYAIDDIRKAHQIEVENLLRTQRSQSDAVSGELDAVKAQHKKELDSLRESYDKVKQEYDDSQRDNDEKLTKLKAFYEKELESMQKDKNHSFAEQSSSLQQRIDKMNKDFQFQEVQYRQRIDGLVRDLAEAETRISDLESRNVFLTDQSNLASGTVNNLMTQLKAAQKELAKSQLDFQEANRELQVIYERCNDQANQLVEKSGVIGELTAAKTQAQSKIVQLEDDLSDVSRKLKILQDEKKLLLSKSSDEAQQKSLEVQALEQALEDLKIEKQAQRDKYEVDISGLERMLAAEKEKAERQLQEKIVELNDRHSNATKTLQSQHDEQRVDMEARHKEQLDNALSEAERGKAELRDRLEKEISELKGQLNSAEFELMKLKQQVGNTSENLGAATNELNDLRLQVSNLEQQLDKSQAQLQSSNNYIETLKTQVTELSEGRQKLIVEHEEELKRKLDELNRSLEETWLNKLRKEVAQLKAELEKQFANDRSSTIQQLSRTKDAEIERLSAESEARLRALTTKIEHLERELEGERKSSSTKLEDLREKYEAMMQELRDQLKELTDSNEETLANLKNNLEMEWQHKLSEQSQCFEDKLADVKSDHMKDISAQMTAHKLAMDMAIREADSARESQLADLEREHSSQMNQLMSDMQIKHEKELEVNNQNNVKQITALRMELQRAVELRNQKEMELKQREEELGEKISHRDRNIQALEVGMRKLEDTIQQLNKEIDRKGKEIHKARSEASRELRIREEELTEQHAEDIEQLNARHSAETQRILGDFTSAQDILKEKISELSLLLEEAEERYRNREPREEDLQRIAQLQVMLQEREQQMQQLLADKQFYQMELVNRETNFTKVFAGSKSGPQQPQVGFINPLAKKKKGEKGPTKFSVNVGAFDGITSSGGSASSTNSQRLRPINGSPIHDDKLNPNSVLPPPQAFTKKFVQ